MSFAARNSLLKHLSSTALSIVLTIIPLWSAYALTAQEAREMAEKYADSSTAEVPHGADLKCQLPNIFKYYKFYFDEGDSTPKLCQVLADYADHFENKILPFWPLKENFGLIVKPIDNIEEFNASFESHPPANKATLSKFHFLYLPGAPVPAQKVVWSHEAGHAALQEILDEHFYPQVRTNFINRIVSQAVGSQKESQLEQLKDQLEQINHQWKNLSAVEQENAHKLSDALGFRIAALDNVLSVPDPTQSILLVSFHEFFADLFAANLYEDLNVVGKSFDELGLKSSPSDFRRLNPASGGASAKGWNSLETHAVFTPARHYYGKNIAGRIQDKKRFMMDLAQYFIKSVENPLASDFLSYQPIIDEIEKRQSSEDVATAINSRKQKAELFSWQRYEQIKNFCDLDLKACKIEIVDQLKRGRNGIFLTNVRPEIANEHLIEAMEQIARAQE